MQMNKTVIIFVNGILSSPEDVEAWTDRAVGWVNKNTDYKSDKMEYRSGTLTRRWYQNQRVKNLQKICKSYLGDRIILVSHSNGADIVERMIQKGLTGRIHELHLIAAASEHDFVKNGYNNALKSTRVGKIVVYMSPIDEALKKARWSTRLFGWLGLGYGYLGLVGPLNVKPEVKDMVVVHNEPMSHSQWFSKKFFEKTMATIVGKA